MRRLLLIVLICAFGYWVYQVPLKGRLPRLSGIKSSLIMKMTSNSFTNTGTIPDRYTCIGENINPQLEFSGIPADTKSLALIMDDPDAPNGTFTHWVVFNMPPSTKTIPEGGPIPGVQAKNGAELKQYAGPCPPSGVHRYYLKLYALDLILPSDEVVDKAHLLTAMSGHILDSVELMGKFSKTK